MGYILHLLSFASMLIIPCIWCPPLQHSLCRPPWVVFLFGHYRKKASVQYIKDNGPPTTLLQDCQTQLLGYLTPACDCYWNNARGRRIHDPDTFVPPPSSYISLWTPCGRAMGTHSSLVRSPQGVPLTPSCPQPLHQLKIRNRKPPLYFLQTLSPFFF